MSDQNGSSSENKMKEEILLSKRMFFAGCLGLPWLWICNALYFRLKVFGPMVMVDYWPGRGDPPSSSSATQPGEVSNNGGDGDDSNGEQQQQLTMEQQLERQMEQKELEKWVKRSTRGAIVVMTLFVAWIITFQLNKEHFGPKWFVMDETEAELTGW